MVTGLRGIPIKKVKRFKYREKESIGLNPTQLLLNKAERVSMEHYFSMPGLLDGVTNHYDSSGRLVAYSQEGIFEGVDEHFDASGRSIGFSMDGLIADKEHFNRAGEYAGFSQEGILGCEEHFGPDGYAGFSAPGLFATDTFIDSGFLD